MLSNMIILIVKTMLFHFNILIHLEVK